LGVAQLPLQPPVPLTATHLVTDFDRGVDSLNEWLGKRAWKNHVLGVSRTFVVCDGEIVIGYYCLSSAAITSGRQANDRIELPKAKQRNMGRAVFCSIQSTICYHNALKIYLF
jgi:hypothetical protein